MSRIGRMPITVPAGVEVTIAENNVVTVKGPKGSLTQAQRPEMIIEQEGNIIHVKRPSDDKLHCALHGMTRALLHNMVVGVSEGFKKELEVNGIGYRAAMEEKGLLTNGSFLQLYQGSHEDIPAMADQLLKQGTADFTLVDFHAEATSEKLALGYYLDGRVSALWGTHTHVPTADERVYPKGTGYITDLGMTGPIESVLGVESAQSVESFLGGLPGRYRSPDGPCKLQGAIFTLDSATGLCIAVERVDIR